MERCSRSNGNFKGGCFAIVYAAKDGNCWMKNSSVETSDMTDFAESHKLHVAFPDRTQLDSLNTDCPAEDLSSHTLGLIDYTVHCDREVLDNTNVCWQGYGDCNPKAYDGFYHATSLEECLDYCINEHPLCQAVSYSPDLRLGYPNCWPKAQVPEPLHKPASGSIVHSAVIRHTDRHLINTTCSDEPTYKAPGDKHYATHCGGYNTGVNITSVHTQNATACLDACASSNQSCIAVTFDPTLLGGYRNCYLQNTTNIIDKHPSSMYAFLSDAPTSSSDPGVLPTDKSSNNGASTSSKAWVAGPVIGGLATVAIIVFAILWWRRRRSINTDGIESMGSSSGPIVEKDGYQRPAQLDAPSPPTEMSAGNIPHELPTRYNTRLGE